MTRGRGQRKRQDPVKQHTVPKSYLKAYAGGDLLHVRHRDGRRRDDHVKRLTVRRDFYTFDQNVGRGNYDIENFFSRAVEGQGLRQLQSLASGESLNRVDRHQLATYIASLRIRSVSIFETMQQIDSHLQPLLLMQDWLARNDLDPMDMTDGQKAIILQRFYNHQRSLPTPRESYLRTMLRELPRTRDRLMDWHWQVLGSDEPLLITGDAPVVTLQLSAGWHGLFPTGSPAFIPLTPTQLLIGEEHPSWGSDSLSSDLANVVNQRICDEASDLIMNRPGLTWPRDITLLPERPRLPAPTVSWSKAPAGSAPTKVAFSPGEETIEFMLDALLRDSSRDFSTQRGAVNR